MVSDRGIVSANTLAASCAWTDCDYTAQTALATSFFFTFHQRG